MALAGTGARGKTAGEGGEHDRRTKLSSSTTMTWCRRELFAVAGKLLLPGCRRLMAKRRLRRWSATASTSCCSTCAMPGQDGLEVSRHHQTEMAGKRSGDHHRLSDRSTVPGAVRLAPTNVAEPVGPRGRDQNVADGTITRKQWAMRRLPEGPDAASGARAA